MMEGSIKMADLHLFAKIATKLKVLRLIFVKRTPYDKHKGLPRLFSITPRTHLSAGLAGPTLMTKNDVNSGSHFLDLDCRLLVINNTIETCCS